MLRKWIAPGLILLSLFLSACELQEEKVKGSNKKMDYTLEAVYDGCKVRISPNGIMFFACVRGDFMSALDKFRKLNPKITALAPGYDDDSREGYFVTSEAPVDLSGREYKK